MSTQNVCSANNPYSDRVELFAFWHEPILVAFQIAVMISGFIVCKIPPVVGGSWIAIMMVAYLWLLFRRYNHKIAFEEKFNRAYSSRRNPP